MRDRSRLLALAVLLLAGCHLADQRLFNPHAGVKPKPTPAAVKPVLAVPALVTIDFRTPSPDYEEALASAVREALARRPDAIFTVEVLVPVRGTVEAQTSQAQQGTATAREVAQTIVDAGADQGQIEMTLRADPARRVMEVRVGVH